MWSPEKGVNLEFILPDLDVIRSNFQDLFDERALTSIIYYFLTPIRMTNLY
ncbi:MAG: hypothetical protein ACFFBI_12250 [Promethearchaeota archaeon]